ncbi:MAG TPA: P-loop NTPase fold protein, partial [Fimbriimonadaceae bacterium]|nr:P-loop NTPase fold protein [Fimbriimonadaceae bacterium]
MWSDRETDIDFLGYSSYVEVLSNVALHPELAPLTLGIFGSWGSGKSSLMRMLRKSIDDKNAEKTITIWFNAWRGLPPKIEDVRKVVLWFKL